MHCPWFGPCFALGAGTIKIAWCDVPCSLEFSFLCFKILSRFFSLSTGELSSMRHHKAEVKAITKEKECGLMFEDRSLHFEPGDTIICYTVSQVKQVTDWDPGF